MKYILYGTIAYVIACQTAHAAPDRVINFETATIQNKSCEESPGNSTAGHINILEMGDVDYDLNESTADGKLEESSIDYEYVSKGWAVGCTCPIEKVTKQPTGYPDLSEESYCPQPPLEGRVWITASVSYESNKSIVFEARPISTLPEYKYAPDNKDATGELYRSQTRQKLQYNLFDDADVINQVGNRNWLSFAFSIADTNNPHWYQTDGQDVGNVPSDSTTIVQIWQNAPSFSYHIEPKPDNFSCSTGTADAQDPVVLTAYVYNADTKRTQDPHDPVFRRCIERGEWYRVGMAYQMPEYIAEGKDTPSDPSEDNGLLRGFLLDENGTRIEQLFYLPKSRTDWGFKPQSTCPYTSTTMCEDNDFWGNDKMQVNFGLYRDRQPYKQIIKFDSVVLGDNEGNAFIPVTLRQ